MKGFKQRERERERQREENGTEQGKESSNKERRKRNIPPMITVRRGEKQTRRDTMEGGTYWKWVMRQRVRGRKTNKEDKGVGEKLKVKSVEKVRRSGSVIKESGKQAKGEERRYSRASEQGMCREGLVKRGNAYMRER